MNLNRDEFLLLSRTGRGTYSTRAGPGPDEVFEAGRTQAGLTGRRIRRRARSGLTLRSDGMGRGLRDVLGPRGGRSARASHTLEYIDHEYLELEFAVGFPADGDTLP
jgi:hypothetical protein